MIHVAKIDENYTQKEREIIKNEIGYKEGSRVIDYVPPDNRLSKAFKLEPQKSLVGLSDNLILPFILSPTAYLL